jgi:hypothetical protein
MASHEELAREKVQNRSTIDLSAARGVANREAFLKGCDGVDCRLTSS